MCYFSDDITSYLQLLKTTLYNCQYMIRLLRFFIIGLLTTLSLTAQNLKEEMVYPDTLRSLKDTFFVNSPKFSEVWRHPISKSDTLNLGTHGYRGVTMTIWTDLDTLKIPHVNFPYQQLIKIPIISARDTALCILRFQPNMSNFTETYAKKNRGKINFEIPEVYELANIILYLSDCSDRTANQPYNSGYDKDVEEYFTPFKNHKLIKVLNNQCAKNDYWSIYYGFRENSISFRFIDGSLVYDTPYKHVFYDNSGIFGGNFRNVLYLIQDFADRSNFREFYSKNREYYNHLIDRQIDLLPIKNMWTWLENEFPQRMDAYKIVFSPLIGGSHSTQKFQKGFWREPDFQECLIFINSSERIDSNQAYSEKVKEGLMSGIVFTEIDHNYVNPTSDKFVPQIKNLIKNKDFWASKAAQRNYNNEYAIFNEYMTHSVFCLYIMENYSEENAELIIDRRIKLMERRGYHKFEQFNNRLLRIMENNDLTIYDSYGRILDEMKNIK